jgi:hypothetical protein
MRFNNRVYNLVPNLRNTDGVEWEGIDIIILTRSKSTSVKCNDIYKKS